MACIEVKTETNIILTLSEEEAMWLGSILARPTLESDEDYRKTIYNALASEGFSHEYTNS